MQPLNFDFSHIDTGLAVGLAGSMVKHLDGWAVHSFMLGCTYPHDAAEESKIRFKKDFQAVLTRELELLWGIPHEANDPDVQILVEFDRGLVTTRLRPVFIGGHYTKFSRQLAQTIHYCLYCKGRGCLHCKGKGRTEFLSVQEKIAPFFEAACRGSGNFFHGAGREDVDVRMLGKGRPFVIEITEPHIRFFDLFGLASSVNDALHGECEVHDLYFTNRLEVARIKEARHEKIYRAIVRTGGAIEPQSIAHLAGQSFEVAQRTPSRVEHRRVDLIRNRHARILKTMVLEANCFEIEIRTDAGLYVKEFIHGDKGRSEPSLSSILGAPCSCVELDVLEIVEPALEQH